MAIKEVALILEEPTHPSSYSCNPGQFVEMAEVVLRQRLRICAMMNPVLDVQ